MATPLLEEKEDYSNDPVYQGFLNLLRGGIQAEGNSPEELEEISSTLAREPEYRRDPHSEGNNL